MAQIAPLSRDSSFSEVTPIKASYLSSFETSRKSSTRKDEEPLRSGMPQQKKRGTETRKHQNFLNRKTLANLLLYFACGMAYIITPWLILRHGFGLDLICYDETDEDSEYPTCESDALEFRRSFYLSFHFFITSFYYWSTLPLCTDPSGQDHKRLIKWQPLLSILSILVAYGPQQFHLIVTASPSFLAIFFGLISKKGNKPGVTLVVILVIQYGVTNMMTQSMGHYMDEPFLWGFKYAILIPFYVQANQALTIFVCQRLSSRFTITDYNRDWLIVILKYQMAFLSTLKLAGLISLLDSGDFLIPFIVNVLLDALGRNQVWRIAYRRIRSTITGKPVSKKKLSYMAQVALSSELDMDYMPMVLILLVNIANSPMALNVFTIFHVSDSYLTLKTDSLMNQNALNLTYLLLTIVAGDVLTYALARLLTNWRVYDIEFSFCQRFHVAILHGSAATSSNFSNFLSITHLLASG